MSANDHEESDSRIYLHVYALNEGASTVQVRTVDTDVVSFWLEYFAILPSTIQECSYMGRLCHREALPLLPLQLNLPRTFDTLWVQYAFYKCKCQTSFQCPIHENKCVFKWAH